MQDTTIAVDVAKSVFEVAVSRHPGKVAERHRPSREAFLRFFAYVPSPAEVATNAVGFIPGTVERSKRR
jgi:hypothetical protein